MKKKDNWGLYEKPKFPILYFLIKCLIILIQLLCTTKSFIYHGSMTRKE